MRRFLISIALAGIVTFAMSCASEQRVPSIVSDGQMPAEFDRVLRDYETAWRAKDAQSLANLFAENSFVLSSGNPPVRGRDSIRKHYGAAGGPLHLRALAWAREDRIGYIIGEYASDAAFTTPGKFTLTLVRGDDDRWLILSDMDNASSRAR